MAAIPDCVRRWYFSREELLKSPARQCQIEPEKELFYRQQAANLIQDMGQRLQVNQLCINTAIVYMHRFYVFHSFHKFPRNSIAAAALFLAAKVEEQPHKLEHVIKVHHACLHRGGPVLDTNSDAYLQQAQELVINESILLQTLGFEVAVDHPHTHVVKCTQMIRASKDLAQTSYFMATNSLHLTTFCLQYRPTVVACVCIYLVARWSQWEIMKSSDGKDWWEYVDPTVTKELLNELTNEFLRIFDACPSRLKRRISNEKLTSQSRKRPREGALESHSASSVKSVQSSAASVSSIDSGLPGSSNSESSLNTQELTSGGQGDSFSSQDTSNIEGDRLGLHEINMGLPMMESSMFSLDPEYMGGSSYNLHSEKPGPSGSQSDSEPGRASDQQGQPVKKSLKEYREQKERERAKNTQLSRESAPPKPSHTAPRQGTQSNPHPHRQKGNVNSPHTDQRHRDGCHSQGSQKHKPEDRHLPGDHMRAEKQSAGRPEQSGSHPQAKSSGRPTDLKPSRDQRPHSQHRPQDLGSQPAHGASVTEAKYSKSLDQHHKHNRDPVPSSSERKQHLGLNAQGKELKRNGLESRDHGANPRLPETNPRLLTSAALAKPHGPASQRPHHTETPAKVNSSEKGLTPELLGKPHPETLKPIKSEMHRSQRPENQGVLKPEKHRTPSVETLRPQKSQPLKQQRSETPKVPPSEKQKTQPAVPPLVPVVATKRELPSGGLPAVGTQKVEPPHPIDLELPTPQRPERVLVQPVEATKSDTKLPSTPNKHDPLKVQKTEDMCLRKPEVSKVPKSETGSSSKTGLLGAKSTAVSKAKGLEAPKLQKSGVLSVSQKTEVPRLPRTETQSTQRVEMPKPQKSDTSRNKDSEASRKQKPLVPPQQLKEVKLESQMPGTLPSQTATEKCVVSKTQKVAQTQPQRPETPKKVRIKPEQGQTQRPTTSKSQNLQVKLDKLPLDKDSLLTSPKSQKAETPVVQDEIRTKLEKNVAAPSKPGTRKKPLTPPASKSETPVLDKHNAPASQKIVAAKSKQPETSTSDHIEKAKPQRSETVTPKKADAQSKPSTPKSQRSTTPRSRGSPGAATDQVSKPPKVAEARKVAEAPKVAKTDAGETSAAKVVWEPAKPLEVLKPGASDRRTDSESVDADIDKLINEHMAEQSKKQGHEPPPILDIKPTLPLSNATESRERKQERDESSLPKSYREKESHHRKKRSEDHRSRSSGHKHSRPSDQRDGPRVDADGSAEQRSNTTEVSGDSQPHASILTTSSGIRLKIKGLSNSMNSGGTGSNARQEASPDPNRQTSSPGLKMKLSLSKMQANSELHPDVESKSRDRSSGHHHRSHHHHRKHKHHKSRSHQKAEEGSESQCRKRSHSRSESMSSGGRDSSPVISSPAKKRAHRRESHSHPKSLLPSDQSLLSLPMPPMDPTPGYMGYDAHSSASTGQFPYNISEYSHHGPLTTVTALPSSDGFDYPYAYNQSSEGHPPPPPPPPRDDLPPPPPPPPV